MAWVRLSDDFYDHPKIIEAGPLGVIVWISGLAYCNRNLTDGEIPESVARRLVDFDGIAYEVATIGDVAGIAEDDCAPFAVESLVASGLLHRPGHGCDRCKQPRHRHLLYHDYLEYQPSSAEIQTDREAARDRMRRARERRRSADVRPNIDGTSAELRVTPTPTPTKKRTSSADADGEFEAFYASYPRRVGRGQALKAWKTAVRKAEAGLIVEAAAAFAARCAGSDPKFVPHPSTWLNGERWADDAEDSQAEVVGSGDPHAEWMYNS